MGDVRRSGGEDYARADRPMKRLVYANLPRLPQSAQVNHSVLHRPRNTRAGACQRDRELLDWLSVVPLVCRSGQKNAATTANQPMSMILDFSSHRPLLWVAIRTPAVIVLGP